ncbi:UNVERIFIED_CONTAM: hypothetical protein PYX00_011762 [Menopon gallinae]|uniref:Homeobox domain-containing protein n=1 Tax=Menopon gallinae TaxID=328185 RepID=A0AAW2H8C7_9NEOP
MDEWIREMSNKLVELKYAFVESNNRLLDKFESLNSRHKNHPEILQPCVSNNVREMLNARLSAMQRKAVNSIGTCFRSFYMHAAYGGSGQQMFINKRFDKNVIDTLESSFSQNPYPSDKEKMRIQKLHGITYRQVTNWFTNKRNRSKMPLHMNSPSYSSENCERLDKSPAISHRQAKTDSESTSRQPASPASRTGILRVVLMGLKAEGGRTPFAARCKPGFGAVACWKAAAGSQKPHATDQDVTVPYIISAVACTQHSPTGTWLLTVPLNKRGAMAPVLSSKLPFVAGQHGTMQTALAASTCNYLRCRRCVSRPTENRGVAFCGSCYKLEPWQSEVGRMYAVRGYMRCRGCQRNTTGNEDSSLCSECKDKRIAVLDTQIKSKDERIKQLNEKLERLSRKQ